MNRPLPLLDAARRRVLIGAAGLAAAALIPVTSAAREARASVVLVHGPFVDSSSWNGVIARLLAAGHPVVAAPNPLRGLASDADYVACILKSIDGPIVLVGHSYGGLVISNAAAGNPAVKSLVYVAAAAPEAGESAVDLLGGFSGSTLRQTLARPVRLPDGGRDLYILQEKFHAQLAADVSDAQARLMAGTQRPITVAALGEASGPPAWRRLPSWFIYGDRDLAIPPAALAFMAQRAGARKTVEIKGASNLVMVSQADAVANLIAEASAVI